MFEQSKINFNHVFVFGVFFRIIIYTYLIFFPFVHLEQGSFGSWIFQNADFYDYLFVKKLILFNNDPFVERCYVDIPDGSLCMLEPATTFFNNYIDIYNLIFNVNYDHKITAIVGPSFPIILIFTNYNENFPYLLSFLCIFVEIYSLKIWGKYIFKKTNWIYSFLFSLFPLPLMFGYIHSSDIFFYFFSTLIIHFKFNKLQERKYFYSLLILLFITSMIRPAGIIILISVLIYLLLKKSIINRKLILYYIIFIILISFVYYLPYFINESLKVTQNTHPDLDRLLIYLDNLNLNQYVNNSLIILVKFLLIFGYDSSQSGSSIIQIIKFLVATPLLIGFILTIKEFSSLKTIYAIITVVFIFFFAYPTYRYILPIVPILLLNLSLFSFKYIK
tara:strand:- start:54 stop:1223 length:1170 start_codon:yes stop_codon:yes gene_type:complete